MLLGDEFLALRDVTRGLPGLGGEDEGQRGGRV